MGQPNSAAETRAPLLARRVGPLPVWIWFLVFILLVAGFIWWRKRGQTSGGQNSNIMDGPTLTQDLPTLMPWFPNDIQVTVVRPEGDGTNSPDPANPNPRNPPSGPQTPPRSPEPTPPAQGNQNRWFGAIVPVEFYTTKPGDTWQRIHDMFGMTKGWWNLFLFNTAKAFQTHEEAAKPIPPGTKLMIPTVNK